MYYRNLCNGLNLQAGVSMASVSATYKTTVRLKYKDFALNNIGRLACSCYNVTHINSPECDLCATFSCPNQ
jgi:hypothetical protein